MTTINPLTYDQIMETLPALVADCLAMDAEEVTPDMVFCNEGESIEILDLNFRCEKTFGIKSPFRLFLGSRDLLTLDEDGYLTREAIDFIGENYPFFAAKVDADGLDKWRPNDLLTHFTVEMIARFVLHAATEGQANTEAA